ncbi:glutamine cyclotransferase [Chlorella sorokiniana]|uniref:Glutamine cyclotransferase n=1 Tax=Chlorella sorokiniana TaxID=3076 RepID=A0A2P6TN73_CHLSO|nr:glutamine cyclotransferase [Chlorella sorokiniana]|eukprot:PRW50773.1 glutamine cyclotransferase [Chlorella sorokiniana]
MQAVRAVAAAAAAAAAAPPRRHNAATLRPQVRPAAAGTRLRAIPDPSSSSSNGVGDADGEIVTSTRRRRGAAAPPAGGGSLKQEAIQSNREVSDKLIDVFQQKKPTEWRKLIAYSKQWPVLAQGVLDRIEERAAAAAEAGEEEEQLALRRLGRRLATVHEELRMYQQLIDKFRAAPSSDWEGLVSLNRNTLSGEFFKYLDLRIKAAHDAAAEQEALLALAAQLAALVEAYDRVARDQQAMEAAAESFSSLLQVDSLEAADKKIDELAASGKLDPALLLMMAKAYAGSKETNITQEEVKDVMAHLYFKAKESFAQQAPKEVRILKYLLTVDSEADRAQLLEQAFEPGAELEGADVDYLCTTPMLLLNTVENVLALYDSSRGRGTMAGDAASLMSPEVIERLRELQKMIKRKYIMPATVAACFVGLFLFFVLFNGHGRADSSSSGSSGSSKVGRSSKASRSPASRTTAAAADGSGSGSNASKQKPVAGQPGAAQPKMVTYRVVKELPHDPSAFLQGLQFDRRCDAPDKCRDVFWESTGLRGQSTLREVDLETGQVLRSKALPERDFGEGVTRLGDRLYQVTWMSGRAWSYAVGNFDDAKEITTPLKDGWGITSDGTHLIVGDSSETLYWLDPATLEVARKVTVTDNGQPVKWLNELEWVEGLIWGNVWQTDCIAQVDPATGAVVGWLRATGLHARALGAAQADAEAAKVGGKPAAAARNGPPEVLNGVAYDEDSGRLFITGKLWPRIYQIETAEVAADAAADALALARKQCIVHHPAAMLVPLEGAAAVVWPALALITALAATVLIVRRQSSRLAPAGADASGRQLAPIPNPFPWWSDLVLEVTLSSDFPDTVKLHAQHGPLFWWRFLGRRVLMVGTYEAAMALLKGEHDIVEADYPDSVKAMLGPFGMVNTYGKDHTRLKRLMQAAFTPKAIRGYLPRMQASAEEAVAKWEKQGLIHAYEEMKWWTFRVAVELIVGFDQSWVSEEGFPVANELFRVWLEGLFSFPVAIPGTAFARGMKARAALMRRIHASLDLLEAQQAQQEGAAKAVGRGTGQLADSGTNGTTANGTSESHSVGAGDVVGNGAANGTGASWAGEQLTALDLLMRSRDENGKGVSRDMAADSVLTLLFAGHDTSATSLTRILWHLHAHPEAEARLREEQAEVLAKHGPQLTEAALEDMRYTDGVIKEVLRVTPIIQGFPRVALQDFELCGHLVPKGTRLQCSLNQPLRTDARWAGEEDPQAFKPERWLTPAGQKTGAWIPFGGGARMCLGYVLAKAEMKVLLACIYRRHRVVLQEPDEPWARFPLARPKHGMPARFEVAEAVHEE